MKIIKTIVGNLNSRCILKIKKQNWSGFVMPIKGNIFQKLDGFKLEKINNKKFIEAYKKDFLIPLEINNIIGIGKNYIYISFIPFIVIFRKEFHYIF